MTFDELVREAEQAPAGWDFTWLDGRATDERPTWRYFDRVAERAAEVTSLLDLQTGTATMIEALPTVPPLTIATEGHLPNLATAERNLRARGGHLVATREDQPATPLAADTFELVTSRHPVDTWWKEIARVLRPEGTYLAQQVGPDSLRDLSEALMGPLPQSTKRDPEVARAAAERAGLVVTDLRHERTATAFYDIGAVVYFLRVVIWIVPGFTVDRYRARLRALHDQIQQDGGFFTTASRFLIEARKPHR